ncbi:MAG: hypothetical protein AAFV95_24675 [Bacteroidota bacterium]
MTLFKINPEVPGGLGKNTRYDKSSSPWRVTHFHAAFEGWLGGDLMAISPVSFATEKLRQGLEASDLSGILGFEDIEITYSDTIKYLQPDVILPPIYRVLIEGKQGVDDFCVIPNNQIVVTKKALDFLAAFNLSNAEIIALEAETRF